MIKVAKQFGVSNSYMARVCTILNVPRPGRGYWAKLAAGKKPPIIPLPPARPGDQLHWSKDGDIPPQPQPSQPEPRQGTRRVRIPKDYVHRLIRGAKAHFENSRPVDEGAYLRPYKKLLVDITTSKDCLDRALAFANDVFNAFESSGHRVVMAPPDAHFRRSTIDEREVRTRPRDRYYQSGLWSPHRPTVVYIGEMGIGLAIVEMTEKALLRYVKGKYIRDADYIPPKRSRRYDDGSWTTTREIASGRLRLITYSPYPRVDWATDWQETAKSGLTSSLRSIVKSVEAMAVELVPKLEEADRQAEIARQEWIAKQERWKREEDRRRVNESIQASRKHIDGIIQQWSEVMNIERFLSGVEERANELPDSERDEILERLALAREFLGTQDPLDFFLSWKTPAERYRPLYSEDFVHPADEHE